jgi:hypothetical protein
LNDTGQLTSRGHRWTPNRILGVLRNPTYIGQLPFSGERHQAAHEPIIDSELFERAQLLLTERSDSASAQAANASSYLLTGFLRCQRCGHGFVGTAAHGNGGVYRYYTCFSRQRHGTARCDQERLPAGPLEMAIVAETFAAPDDGSIFEAAALHAEQAWHAQHPGRQAELSGTRAALGERRAAAAPKQLNDRWTPWLSRSWSSLGHASSRTSSRPRFVRVPVRGGGWIRARTLASRHRASGSPHGRGDG